MRPFSLYLCVRVCSLFTSVWCGGPVGARSRSRPQGPSRLPWPRARGVGASPGPGILLQQQVKQLTGCRLGIMVPRITGVVTLLKAKVEQSEKKTKTLTHDVKETQKNICVYPNKCIILTIKLGETLSTLLPQFASSYSFALIDFLIFPTRIILVWLYILFVVYNVI